MTDVQGKEKLEYFMDDYEKRKDTLSKKEQDTYRDMKIVQEMYARGFEFVPIDLYKANAHTFQIMEDKLMPALDTIEGLGDRAADAVVLAAEEGEFLSKDDFRNRTKVSKTVIDLMDDLGLFGDLPDSNQMSLFDFSKSKPGGVCHEEKIAPVIITIVVSLLIILWACTGLRETAGLDGFSSSRIAVLLAGIGGVGVLVAVLFIRLKEIDHEDEDDLKKY